MSDNDEDDSNTQLSPAVFVLRLIQCYTTHKQQV